MSDNPILFDALPVLTAARATALLLGVAWAWAAWRHWRRARRMADRLGQVALQVLLAGLLYCVLWPPTSPPRPVRLVVLAQGAQALPSALDEHRVALPEAPALPGVERAPDLASVLSRWPDARLQVRGWGLNARDRDVARGHVATFTPAPLPAGVTSLQVPTAVVPGALARIEGRVTGAPQSRLVLRDPAGRMLASVSTDRAGRFTLAARVREPGWTPFTLERLDAHGRALERLEVPVMVVAPPRPRVWIIAGAPNPEINQLRRWASAGGLPVSLRAPLGGGVVLADRPMAFTPVALAQVDVLVIDPRGWAGLDAAALRAIAAAVRTGLGVVLRVDGPVPAAVRATWQRQLGVALQGDGRGDRVQPQPGDPPMIAWRVALAGADAVPLQHDRDGRILAAWQPLGRGRVALVTLDGSYARALSGQAGRYADGWSGVFDAVARARAEAAPHVVGDGNAWRDERVTVCGLARTARWQDPGGGWHPLAVDVRGCAAFWPERVGHHRVAAATATDATATATAGDTTLDLRVRDPQDAPALYAASLDTATRELLAEAPASGQADAHRKAMPGPRWPWFLAWLAVFAWIGWRERRRRGEHARGG